MYGSISIRIDLVQGHLDDFANTVFIDVVHGECCDIMLAKNLLFVWIYVT